MVKPATSEKQDGQELDVIVGIALEGKAQALATFERLLLESLGRVTTVDIMLRQIGLKNKRVSKARKHLVNAVEEIRELQQ